MEYIQQYELHEHQLQTQIFLQEMGQMLVREEITFDYLAEQTKWLFDSEENFNLYLSNIKDNNEE